ncbi:hypothetical protein GEMRC1_004815 [Eukaryota sp. GEM-RC1]
MSDSQLTETLFKLFDSTLYKTKLRDSLDPSLSQEDLLERYLSSETERERLSLHVNLLQEQKSTLENRLSKLSSLCKTLQDKNKKLSEEASLYVEQQEQHRHDLSAKFQDSISGIEQKIKVESESRMALETERAEMKQRLAEILTQFEEREKSFEAELKKKDLEKQLAQAQLAQETNSKEEAIKVAQQMQQKSNMLEGVLKDRTSQIEEYGDKYKQLIDMVKESQSSVQRVTEESKAVHKEKHDLEYKVADLTSRLRQTADQLITTLEELQKNDLLGKNLPAYVKLYKHNEFNENHLNNFQQ